MSLTTVPVPIYCIFIELVSLFPFLQANGETHSRGDQPCPRHPHKAPR